LARLTLLRRAATSAGRSSDASQGAARRAGDAAREALPTDPARGRAQRKAAAAAEVRGPPPPPMLFARPPMT
jgi:hypothetical protein